MKNKYLVITGLLIIGLSVIFAMGKQEHTVTGNETEQVIQEILKPYDAENLGKDDSRAIHEALREAGLRGGPEVDSIIKKMGFNPEDLKNLTPPPDAAEGKNGSLQPPGEGVHHDQQDSAHQSPGTIFESLENNYGSGELNLFSEAVDDQGMLLSQYKCEKKINGTEKSIPLSWENVPPGTGSLAIVMYHFPHEEDHSHANSYLLLWNIDPAVQEIPYGMAASGDWYMGSDKDGNNISYTSPCSKGSGTHKYTIALFALSETPADLPEQSSIDVDFDRFMTAIENTEIIAKASLDFIDIRK